MPNNSLRRLGASVLILVLVLSLCAGLVSPAYAAEDDTPPDTTTETTQATDATDATDSTDATDATDSADSTETTEADGLTPEEQAQAEAVLAALNALESADQVEANLAALEEDPEGYVTYYNQVLAATQAVRDAYAALSDAQKELVGDITKLNDLDWLVPRQTREESGDQTQDALLGDWAYISALTLSASDAGYNGNAIFTGGDVSFDADDQAGNDSAKNNGIVRTFDSVQYTVSFTTDLHTSVRNAGIPGIKSGRLYFEFLIPGTAEQIRFETGAMGWLSNSEQIRYETAEVTVDGNPYLVFRGSYLMTTGDGQAPAIGASQFELDIVVRVLQMKNGDTFAPICTLWLEHNDVGTSYKEKDGVSNAIPTDLVYGQNKICATTGTLPGTNGAPGGEMAAHGIAEARTLDTIPAVTVSARPMFNVAIMGGDSRNINIGPYNFNDADPNAINYGLGSVYGRLNGYGLRLELRGKGSGDGSNGQGMVGAEFPDENTPITFTLTLSTTFRPGDATTGKAIDGFDLLFWSGGGNSHARVYGNNVPEEYEDGTINPNRRSVNTSFNFASRVPANRIYGESQKNGSCYNGGQWQFEDLGNNQIKVTVTGFDFNPEHFPTVHGATTMDDAVYYDPARIENYWDIGQAVFSAGEFWIIQPYETLTTDSEGNRTHITDLYPQGGSFRPKVVISDFHMETISGQEANDNNWFSSSGKQYLLDQLLEPPGSMSVKISYMKGLTPVWNEGLVPGGYDWDTDWAAPGTELSLQLNLMHDGAEGMNLGVAYEMLLKFDDRFFEPLGNIRGLYTASKPYTATFYWGFRPDYTGWGGNVEAMKAATVDDLIYIPVAGSDIQDLMKNGKVPVALLAEIRGMSVSSDQNHFLLQIPGHIRSDCPADQVYMITHCCYAWRKRDVADQALAYYNATHSEAEAYDSPDQLTDEDYIAYARNEDSTYAHLGFPNRKSGNAVDMLPADYGTAPTAECPTPSFRLDYHYSSQLGVIGGNGEIPPETDGGHSYLYTCAPAQHVDGQHIPGNGAPKYQDSCLAVSYAVSVSKTVAQKEVLSGSGDPKIYYKMDDSQRAADFQLNVEVSRPAGADNTDSAQSGVITIREILPAGLSFLGNAWLGGEYEQDVRHQKPGTVEGGQKFVNVSTLQFNEPNAETPLVYAKTDLDGGRTELLFKIYVPAIDINGGFSLDPIRYSCAIGTPGNEETDVSNGDLLTSQVSIWATGDSSRLRNTTNGNYTENTIKITKSSGAALVKTSDQPAVEVGQEMGFTMSTSNNSANTMNGLLIVETLPANNIGSTSFHGPLVASSFHAGVLDSQSQPVENNFRYFYTTNAAYTGLRSEELKQAAEAKGLTLAQWLTPEYGWQSLTLSTTTTDIVGLPLYAAQLPADQGDQIVAIVALGDLPGNSAMKMHISLSLPQGHPADHLENYFSQGELFCFAQSYVIRRTLAGCAWLDADKDGIRTADEELLDGVQVSLKKLDGANYVPVYYQDTNKAVVIQTGQQVSLLSESTLRDYDDGSYRFTDLPAGTYAVFFENGGTTRIAHFTVSPIKAGTNVTCDSNGMATVANGMLHNAYIPAIVFANVENLTSSTQDIRYQDCGFYPTEYELPLTGGMGTTLFTALGFLLTTGAALGLRRKKKK